MIGGVATSYETERAQDGVRGEGRLAMTVQGKLDPLHKKLSRAIV